MIFYIIFASIIFWLGYANNNRRTYKVSLWMLFLLTACRAWRLGGTDAQIYHRFFENAVGKEIFVDSYYSVGYVFLNYIIRLFTSNYYVFQVIYAAITIYLLHLVLKKIDITWAQKCTLLFSYFCLRFFYNEWIALRQNLANLLFWYFVLCIYQCEKDRPIKKIALIVASIAIPNLFHSSALFNIVFLFVLWVMSKIQQLWIKATIVPIISVGLYFTGARLLGPILNIVEMFGDDRYEMYVNTAALGSNIVYFVLRMFFFMAFCYRYNNSQSKSKAAALDIFSVMLMIAAVDLEIVSRVFEYFAIGLYIAIGTFFDTFTDESKNVAAVIFYVCMTIILVRFLGTFTSPSFVPYQFWR